MKKILSILLVGILSFGLVACNKTEGDTKEVGNSTKQEEKKSKLDSIKDSYKKAGFEVGENETIAFQMVGANNGYKFKLDGELIEIYEYDSKNLSEEGKKISEQAKKGSISFSGFNSPVKFNDGLMIMRYGEHSKKDKVLEVFNNFK